MSHSENRFHPRHAPVVTGFLFLGLLLWTACASSPYSAFNQGILDTRDGTVDQAENAFWQALKTDPDNAEAWNQLGILAFERNQFQQAQIRFRNAMERDRLSGVYPRNLAMVFAEQRQYNIAHDLLKKSLELDPYAPDTHVAEAKVFWLEGRMEGVRASIQKALAIDPSHEEARRLASRLQMQNN